MSIPGLFIHNGYLNEQQQKELLNYIDSVEWSNDLKRKTQHYGGRYDYVKRKVLNDRVLSFEKDAPLNNLRNNLVELFDGKLPDQCIVNEYLSGQSISQHIDAKCFGPIIVTVSLGDYTNFVMSKNDEKVNIKLNGGDLLILKNDARHLWKHQTTPVYDKNYRRVSITFRTIN